MKKFIFALIVMALPMTIQAQSEGLLARKSIKSANADLSTYAAKGAVPEVDGKIVFKADILAPGKTKEDLYQKVAQWASYRYSANSVRGNYTDNDFFKNLEYATVKSADKNSGRFQCQGAEELIFSIKPLAKNYTQAFYLLDLVVSNGQVSFNLNSLSFNVDQGEGQFTRVAAEDWISDKECINKKGELRRIPGKFRIKTIDLVEELKKEISEAVNQ
ncbi:MAG: DUF4468 domain-containing protein [Bacteroidaceae bacterium]|nr:DUF4468 domain-containing protein [Bacteroidaceae bacterium]